VIISDVIQGTDAWLSERAGRPTSSNFSRILTATGKRSTQRNAYLYKLAGERVTGNTEDGYKGASMQRGNELEPSARQFYQMKTGSKVDEVGLCFPDEDKKYSCSPDGIILEDKKGLEIKCPELSAATEYLYKGKLPTKYVVQVQGSMLVTGYEAWDFMSYYPGMRPLMLQVEPDIKFQATLKDAVLEFCHELEEIVNQILI